MKYIYENLLTYLLTFRLMEHVQCYLLGHLFTAYLTLFRYHEKTFLDISIIKLNIEIIYRFLVQNFVLVLCHVFEIKKVHIDNHKYFLVKKVFFGKGSLILMLRIE